MQDPSVPFEVQARSARTVHHSQLHARAPPSDLDTPAAADLDHPPPPYEQPAQVVPDEPIQNADDIAQLIRSANTSIPQSCVKALKRVQIQLVETPHLFAGNVPLLISTVTRQFERLFEKPAAMDDTQMFRMAKHLIQTMSNFCDLPELLSEMNSGLLEDLLEQLTLGLLLLTKETHKEMAKFVNMTILRLFATSNQVVLFRYVLVTVIVGWEPH
jgi:cytoskeleton-associated protein 5